MAMIGFLDRGAAGNLHIWLSPMDRGDPFSDYIEGSGDAPDAVMHLSRTVDRYDDVIEQRGDLFGALEQQQAGG